jgi:pseudouridine-5'-phosphate glycosidase
VDSARELAAICGLHWNALAGGGILVANPIPEPAELPAEVIDEVIATAITAASARGLAGKALTPFLLAEIARATHGKSVEANRALALANAALGAELAVALADRS